MCCTCGGTLVLDQRFPATGIYTLPRPLWSLDTLARKTWLDQRWLDGMLDHNEHQTLHDLIARFDGTPAHG